MRIDKKKLEEFIKDSGLVSKSDLEMAIVEAEKSDSDVANILVGMGKLTEDEVRRIKAYILGIPFINLVGKKIDFDVFISVEGILDLNEEKKRLQIKVH